MTQFLLRAILLLTILLLVPSCLNEEEEESSTQTIVVEDETNIDDDSNDNSNDTPAETVADITASLSYPTLSDSAYGSHKASAFTVSVTHDGDSVTCSRDGGSTFGDCNLSNSSDSNLVWLAANASAQHVVRVIKSGASNSPYDMTFTPSSQFSGVDFYDCSETVSAAENFNAFEARVGANKVICINDGVTITNSGSEDRILVTVDGVTIIGNAGDPTQVNFVNTRNDTPTNASGIEVDADNFKVIGLKVKTDGEYAHPDGSAALHIKEGHTGIVAHDAHFEADGDSYTLIIEGSDATLTDVNIRANDFNSNAVWLTYPLTGSRTITVERMTLWAQMYGLNSDNFVSGATGSMTVNLNNSTFEGYIAGVKASSEEYTFNIDNTTMISTSGDALSVDRGIVNVTNSTMIARGTADAAAFLRGIYADVTISGSTFQMENDARCVEMDRGSTLAINNNVFRRVNGGSSADCIFGKDSSVSLYYEVNSSNSASNTFCYENAGNTHTNVINEDGTVTRNGNFTAPSVAACP